MHVKEEIKKICEQIAAGQLSGKELVATVREAQLRVDVKTLNMLVAEMGRGTGGWADGGDGERKCDASLFEVR